MTRTGRRAAAALATLLAFPSPDRPGAAAAQPAGAIVRTEAGPVGGITDEPGVVSWRGIPYAAPPVGPLRWRPPMPAPVWRGVRDARRFGPVCPQAPLRLGAGTLPMSEDCLSLSVTAPAGRTPRLRPVMVWIHGGAFLGGASSLPLYDGASLARLGVVFVALNYRLGALGWLAHPALSAESAAHVSGNYGLLDQMAALGWVRRNIRLFGGDPDRVTVFGESAGATAIRALLIAPAANGLFSRAIMESPAAGFPMTTLAEAERAGLSLGRNAKALRAMSVAALVAAGRRFEAPSDTLVPMSFPAPVVDGDVIPLSWEAALRAGTVRPVPVLVGSNDDEGLLFGPSLPVGSAAGFAADLGRMFGALAPEAARFYPADTLDDARASAVRLIGDQRYVIGAAAISRGMAPIEPDTWRYVFRRRLGDGLMPPTHAAELPFVFDTIRAPLPVAAAHDEPAVPGVVHDRNAVPPVVLPDERDREVARLTGREWVRFAETGNPNGPGLPDWPRAASGTVMVIDAPPSVAPPPDGAAVALIARRYAERGASAP